MVTAGVRSLWIVAALLIWSAAALAQTPQAPVNPRALEFDFPAEALSDIVGYWVEVFPRGLAVAKSTLPVKVFYLARAPRGNQGGLRVDFGNNLDGLADGEYVVTLSVVDRSGGQSARSAPSEPFALSGLASRRPAAPTARRDPTNPTPQSGPVAVQATPNHEPHSKWWWTLAFVGVVLTVYVSLLF